MTSIHFQETGVAIFGVLMVLVGALMLVAPHWQARGLADDNGSPGGDKRVSEKYPWMGSPSSIRRNGAAVLACGAMLFALSFYRP